jgi:hypothetical protein
MVHQVTAPTRMSPAKIKRPIFSLPTFRINASLTFQSRPHVAGGNEMSLGIFVPGGIVETVASSR